MKECFKIENCYGYLVVSEDREIIEELEDLMTCSGIKICWCNFESEGIYYSENSEEYRTRISHHMEMVVLEKM